MTVYNAGALKGLRCAGHKEPIDSRNIQLRRTVRALNHDFVYALVTQSDGAGLKRRADGNPLSEANRGEKSEQQDETELFRGMEG